ncbi:hypothetical protein D3C78_1348610 [compost metagenome]
MLRQGHHLEDAGVVDQHVDLAQLRFGFIEHPTNIGGRGHVCLHRYGLVAGLAQLHHQFGRLAGAVGVVDDDGETLAGQLLGDFGADAAGSTGNDGNFGRLSRHA